MLGEMERYMEIEYLNNEGLSYVQYFDLRESNLRFYINTGAFPNRIELMYKKQPAVMVQMNNDLSAI